MPQSLPDDWISAYLDGELTADQKRRAEQLLATDQRHAQLLEQLRQMREDIQLLPRYKVNDEFTQRVIDRARNVNHTIESNSSDSIASTSNLSDSVTTESGPNDSLPTQVIQKDAPASRRANVNLPQTNWQVSQSQLKMSIVSILSLTALLMISLAYLPPLSRIDNVAEVSRDELASSSELENSDEPANGSELNPLSENDAEPVDNSAPSEAFRSDSESLAAGNAALVPPTPKGNVGRVQSDLQEKFMPDSNSTGDEGSNFRTQNKIVGQKREADAGSSEPEKELADTPGMFKKGDPKSDVDSDSKRGSVKPADESSAAKNEQDQDLGVRNRMGNVDRSNPLPNADDRDKSIEDDSRRSRSSDPNPVSSEKKSGNDNTENKGGLVRGGGAEGSAQRGSTQRGSTQQGSTQRGTGNLQKPDVQSRTADSAAKDQDVNDDENADKSSTADTRTRPLDSDSQSQLNKSAEKLVEDKIAGDWEKSKGDEGAKQNSSDSVDSLEVFNLHDPVQSVAGANTQSGVADPGEPGSGAAIRKLSDRSQTFSVQGGFVPSNQPDGPVDLTYSLSRYESTPATKIALINVYDDELNADKIRSIFTEFKIDFEVSDSDQYSYRNVAGSEENSMFPSAIVIEASEDQIVEALKRLAIGGQVPTLDLFGASQHFDLRANRAVQEMIAGQNGSANPKPPAGDPQAQTQLQFAQGNLPAESQIAKPRGFAVPIPLAQDNSSQAGKELPGAADADSKPGADSKLAQRDSRFSGGGVGGNGLGGGGGLGGAGGRENANGGMEQAAEAGRIQRGESDQSEKFQSAKGISKDSNSNVAGQNVDERTKSLSDKMDKTRENAQGDAVKENAVKENAANENKVEENAIEENNNRLNRDSTIEKSRGRQSDGSSEQQNESQKEKDKLGIADNSKKSESNDTQNPKNQGKGQSVDSTARDGIELGGPFKLKGDQDSHLQNLGSRDNVTVIPGASRLTQPGEADRLKSSDSMNDQAQKLGQAPIVRYYLLINRVPRQSTASQAGETQSKNAPPLPAGDAGK
jgi:hypothetical protein